ncbi:MAG TPA: SAM-dependent methyltransferase [Solirubrobacteraceae bacterium]
MSTADFEALYRSDPDPWGYTTSAYEHDKYSATLAACGPGPFRCALELGGSIGVFSALLASRCDALTTIDAAPTAVATARGRLAQSPQVTALEGTIPEAIPRRRYDLVVASEILYYLTPAQLSATLTLLGRLMDPGARLVAVHWRPAGPDRPFTASEVHDALRRQPWLQTTHSGGTDEYLLDVLERR